MDVAYADTGGIGVDTDAEARSVCSRRTCGRLL